MNICEDEGETRGYDTYSNGCVNIPFSGTSPPFEDMEHPQRGEGSLPTKGPVEQAQPVFQAMWSSGKSVCSGMRQTRFKSLSGLVQAGRLHRLFNVCTSGSRL